VAKRSLHDTTPEPKQYEEYEVKVKDRDGNIKQQKRKRWLSPEK
jgi:hypothetical protein